MDNGSTHDIPHNGSVYKVTIIATLASFKYECSVNGKKLTSHLERPSAVQEDLVFKVTEGEELCVLLVSSRGLFLFIRVYAF